jgi:hypothetical protein
MGASFHPHSRMKGPGFPLQSFLRLLRIAKKDFRFNPLRGRLTPHRGIPLSNALPKWWELRITSPAAG